jgi:hypothetical protein
MLFLLKTTARWLLTAMMTTSKPPVRSNSMQTMPGTSLRWKQRQTCVSCLTRFTKNWAVTSTLQLMLHKKGVCPVAS